MNKLLDRLPRQRLLVWSLCISIIGIGSGEVWGQDTGVLQGRILAPAHEAVIGANVWVVEAERGAATNLEGYFIIPDIAVGQYTVRISAISYETKTFEKVSVQAGDSVWLAVQLAPEDILLEEVRVQAERVRDNEATLLDLQRKSTRLFEGLSAQQIGRAGDNQVGAAVKRMVGVTVESGKYMYVRGLGDRYSLTYLNGAHIPGLDPNRNSAQLDIFPTALINNLTIHKAFSPDLPGDFAGGYLDIETKDIPDGRVLSFGTSLGYTSGVHLQGDYLTYTGGRLDWLGIDDGTRQRPVLLREGVPSLGAAEYNPASARRLQTATQSFGSTEMAPYTRPMFLNQRYAFSIGNRYSLWKRPFGYMLALSYQRDRDSYRGGLSSRQARNGPEDYGLTPLLSLDDASSSDNVLWGALLNLGYRFHDNHRMTLTLMHNQKGNKTARQQSGRKPEDDPDLQYLTNGLWYTERGMSAVQLKGQHTLAGLRPLQIDWISSGSRATISQPDLRFFTYGYQREQAEPTYLIQPSIGQLPTRYFRDMEENVWDTRLHLRKPFLQWAGHEAAVKVGGAYSWKERQFRESQYSYDRSSGVGIVPDGSPDKYIAADNLWDGQDGVYLVDATIDANNYDARQHVWASYGLVELPLWDKLSLLTGLRYEGTALSLQSFDVSKEEGKLQLHDLLPSLSFTYALRTDMNLQAAYGRTIARPTFRELAPFASFDFIGDYLLMGNPALQRTVIDNLDLRAAWYPAAGEVLSLSTFYKRFDQPIERTFNIKASGTELTFRNVDKAQVAGLELNMRKRLGLLHPRLQALTLATNFTYAYSWVAIDEEELLLRREYDADASSTRAMFGQSPYVVNVFLGYESKRHFAANVSYNIFGERLSVVAKGAPDIYEQPRSALNMSVSQMWNRWTFKLGVNNILDAEYRFTQTFRGRTYPFQTYRQGRDISLSASYAFEQ